MDARFYICVVGTRCVCTDVLFVIGDVKSNPERWMTGERMTGRNNCKLQKQISIEVHLVNVSRVFVNVFYMDCFYVSIYFFTPIKGQGG